MELGVNNAAAVREAGSHNSNMEYTKVAGVSSSAEQQLFHPAQVVDEETGHGHAAAKQPNPVEDAAYRLEEGRTVFPFAVEPDDSKGVKEHLLQRPSAGSDMLPAVDVGFKNLTLDIIIPGDGPVKRLVKKCLKRPPRLPSARRILSMEGVSATFYPGDCVAILGSSGAGKTTFLNVLAGRVTRNVRGHVYFNGAPSSPTIARTLSCFIQQECFFFGSLTVREHLRYQAGLRLSPGLSRKQREAVVQTIIDRVGLSKAADRKIGNVQAGETGGISGGEQRRLAVASELLTHPCVIFADEPTSGLDSYMAVQVGLLLRSFAEAGRTVVATIHQPSTSTFELFNKVVLLSEGLLLYCGPRDGATAWFSRLGEKCAPDMNPAEFLVAVAAARDSTREADVTRLRLFAETWKTEGRAFLRFWEEQGREESTSEIASIQNSMALLEDSGQDMPLPKGLLERAEEEELQQQSRQEQQQEQQQQERQRSSFVQQRQQTPSVVSGCGEKRRESMTSHESKRGRSGEEAAAGHREQQQQQQQEEKTLEAMKKHEEKNEEGDEESRQIELAAVVHAAVAARGSRLTAGGSPRSSRSRSRSSPLSKSFSLLPHDDACAAALTAVEQDRIGIISETWLHFKRCLRLSLRDPFATYGRILQALVTAIIPALLYFRLTWTGADVYNKISASFYTVLGQAMAAIFGTTFSFQTERPFIQREYEAGATRMPCYYVGRVTADSLLWCVSPFVYHTVVYWVVNLGGDSTEKYFASFGIMLLSVQCMISYTYMVVSGIQNPAVAMATLQVIQMLIIIFSGFMMRLDRMGRFWVWLMYLSPLRYSLNCFVVTMFRGVVVYPSPGWHIKGTEFISDAFGFSEGDFWLDIGLLFVLAAGARILGMVFLTISAARTKENE